MKLELKHIAGYLPYSILLQFEDNMNHHLRTGGISNMQPCIDDDELTLIDDELEGQEVLLSECKLILRPLSDLYKPLEDGSVPIVELAKIAFDFNEDNFDTEDWQWEQSEVKLDGHDWYVNHDRFNWVKFNFRDSVFEKSFDSEGVEGASNLSQIFSFLYSKHYDLHGLIEKGLALDINQIKE